MRMVYACRNAVVLVTDYDLISLPDCAIVFDRRVCGPKGGN